MSFQRLYTRVVSERGTTDGLAQSDLKKVLPVQPNGSTYLEGTLKAERLVWAAFMNTLILEKIYLL